MGAQTSGNGQYNSEINVTPMVDVMLVLLVIFMVTAPVLNTGVEVDTPNVAGEPVNDPGANLSLSIDKRGKLFLGSKKIDWSELEDFIKNNAKLQKERVLFVEADKHLPYRIVVSAMAIARRAGIIKVQLLTDPSAQMSVEELDKGIGPQAVSKKK